MNGKELLERGLQSGVPLWRIEDELDWQENAVLSTAICVASTGGRASHRQAAVATVVFLLRPVFQSSHAYDEIPLLA